MKTFIKTSLAVLLLVVAWHQTDAQSMSRKWVKIDGCTLLRNPSNDGDSFHVRAEGKERIFRLYFVDCPETSDHNAEMKARIREQSDTFKLPPSEIMKMGKKASDFTLGQLSKTPFTVYTSWENAGGASDIKRYFAYVVVNGRGLDELLVENGWARVFGRPVNLPNGTDGFKHREKLQKLEDAAKRKKIGVWNKTW